jgi:hypothetical protein
MDVALNGIAIRSHRSFEVHVWAQYTGDTRPLVNREHAVRYSHVVNGSQVPEIVGHACLDTFAAGNISNPCLGRSQQLL